VGSKDIETLFQLWKGNFMERIVLAAEEDVKSVAELYEAVNEYFEANENYCYPNWQKGKYPVSNDAQIAFEEKTLYVIKNKDVVLGSMIINNKQHPEYKRMPWKAVVPDEAVMTIHTLVVSPKARNQGIGEQLVRFGVDFCKNAGAKTIRIDTHFRNVPARQLYLKCGFQSLGCQHALVDGIMQEFDVLEYIFK